MKHTPFTRLLANAFQIPLRPLSTKPLSAISLLPTFSHPFTTTPSFLARKSQKPRGDRRIALIRYFLQHPLTPRPLRFSRNRSLRHWTISRAFLLYRRSQKIAQTTELERQYNAMRAANEELRTGVGDDGRLFRQAMTKKGVWGGLGAERGREGGVPVEYGRFQTEGPGREGWDEGWTR